MKNLLLILLCLGLVGCAAQKSPRQKYLESLKQGWPDADPVELQLMVDKTVQEGVNSKLKPLKQTYEADLITPKEYEAKKKELLDTL